MSLANIVKFHMQRRAYTLTWTDLLLVDKHALCTYTGSSFMLMRWESARRSVSCSLQWPRCRAKQPPVTSHRYTHTSQPTAANHLQHHYEWYCSIGLSLFKHCRQQFLKSHKCLCRRRISYAWCVKLISFHRTRRI